MKFTSLVAGDACQNVPLVEQIVREWHPPDVSGEVILCEENSTTGRACFQFRGVVGGQETVMAGWSVDELLLQHPLLISALELIVQKFLASIPGSVSVPKPDEPQRSGRRGNLALHAQIGTRVLGKEAL